MMLRLISFLLLTNGRCNPSNLSMQGLPLLMTSGTVLSEAVCSFFGSNYIITRVLCRLLLRKKGASRDVVSVTGNLLLE